MNDNETADQLYADIAGRAVANENDSKEAATRSIANICKWLSERGFSRVADEIFAAHKREIDELKKQASIAKDAFFKIVQCGHSQAVHDIVCEAEFMMNHPECRNEAANG